MRIISGYLKSLHFESPNNTHTHPMSEKMRGALFNILGDIEKLTVFDAYGGTGAISFEAISRGAKSSLITENDKSALKTIVRNINLLHLSDKVHVVNANCITWSKSHISTQFDLVICDPPYDDIHDNQLEGLASNVIVGGLLIISLPTDYHSLKFKDFEIELSKEYGDGSLFFYRKK